MSRRLAYLAEIGITAYRLRRAPDVPAPPDVLVDTGSGGPAPPQTDAAVRVDEARDAAPADARMFDAADAPAAARSAAPADALPSHAACSAALPAMDDADAWRTLTAEVKDCRKCALHRTRTQAVVGVGRRDAALLVVGEAPGEEEDRQGEPFVGPAGRLLNAMLKSIGFPREQVYIANILKCRPPGNRDPRPDEADACADFLNRQIALIRPKAMLAVGRISAQRLLDTDLPVGRLRGVVHRYGDSAIPLVVTYHPAYLLRTPIAKAKSWQDLCMLLPLLRS